uniref:3-phosphoinositide-dependent protein kinase 1 n=1 Tax=Syphacia muris TaxID=451379 RepID=A0A0N5ABF5_9BILA
MVMKIFYTFSTKNHYCMFILLWLSKILQILLFVTFSPMLCKATIFFTAEIIAALEWLHRCLVVHRDLKPQNILVKNDYHILISDFSNYGELPLSSDDDDNDGSSKEPRLNRSTFVGTALYISPEVLDRREVSPTCDYWAFGCILLEMLSSRSPFAAANALQCIEKIRKLEYVIPSSLPTAAKDLIKKLLVADPKRRLGAKGTYEIMEHQFFADVKWDNLLSKTPPNSIRSARDAPGELIIPPDAKPGLGAIEESRKSSAIARRSKVDKERDFLLSEQRKKNRYHRFVNNKLIVKQGILEKKKGLFSRTRMFLLTDGPDLWYVEPEHLVLKGKVPFTKQMKTEIVNFGLFFIHTPHRTYYLSDPNLEADRWALAIDNVQKLHWDELDEEPLPDHEPPRSGRYAIWVR